MVGRNMESIWHGFHASASPCNQTEPLEASAAWSLLGSTWYLGNSKRGNVMHSLRNRARPCYHITKFHTVHIYSCSRFEPSRVNLPWLVQDNANRLLYALVNLTRLKTITTNPRWVADHRVSMPNVCFAVCYMIFK